jgi:hypothetical protein
MWGKDDHGEVCLCGAFVVSAIEKGSDLAKASPDGPRLEPLRAAAGA